MHRRAGEPYFLWMMLAAVFLFLCIDETSVIHERFTEPVRARFDTSGPLYYAWIIPYSFGLLLLLALYSRFLWRLPRQIALLFIVSGALFVSGAIGFEIVGGLRAEEHGESGLLYAAFYTCEESLEMLGVAVFIYALLRHIVGQCSVFTVTLRGPAKDERFGARDSFRH